MEVSVGAEVMEEILVGAEEIEAAELGGAEVLAVDELEATLDTAAEEDVETALEVLTAEDEGVTKDGVTVALSENNDVDKMIELTLVRFAVWVVWCV